MFEGFHRAIIDAHVGEKEKIQSENKKQFQTKPKEETEDCSSSSSKNDDVIHKVAPTHQGKLILDATVVKQRRPGGKKTASRHQTAVTVYSS